jgi:hypothetical protein
MTREELAKSLAAYLHKVGAWVTSPIPTRGNRLRFEATPAFGETLAEDLRRHSFAVCHVGEGERLLPGKQTQIRDARGNIRLQLDGGVSPQAVSIWEIELPAEKPHKNPESEVSSAKDREQRRQRLYQSRRQIVGA